MQDRINEYASAVVSGNMAQIQETLSSTVRVCPPGSNQPNEGIQKNAMMLSAVAASVDDLKFIRSYNGESNWSAILLEGTLDGQSVQFIDQIHVSDDGKVDHVDIFLRPATLAAALLAKVTAAIQEKMK